MIDELSLTALLLGSMTGAVLFVEHSYQFFTSNQFKAYSPTWSPWIERDAVERLNTCLTQITDEPLQSMIVTFAATLKEVDLLNGQWLERLAQYFNTPLPKTEQEMNKLCQKISRHRKKSGAFWIQEQQFQALAEDTRKLIPQIQDLAQKIEQRVMHVYSHLSPFIVSDEEFGDQRASDLIDEAESLFDPRQAIKLLQKALRYGKTGIQASKAYMGLGLRYEDLGDTTQAIKHYTQALEAWRPSSIVHFWRGRLYYSQEQWEKAREDFERALAFSPEGALFASERKEAEQYLAEITQQMKS